MPATIATPDDPALSELCERLAALSADLDASAAWPAEQLRLCGEYGVYRWFAGEEWGGLAWDEAAILRGYLALSSACLTTTFILTQREGACRRLETSANEPLKALLLPELTRGDRFATVGISHLTTSRRHLAQPVLQARRTGGGFVLDGYSPWVTGADAADYIVIGATLVDGDQPTAEQLLAAVPTNRSGASAGEPAQLVALSASRTGQFRLDNVLIDESWLVAGPLENVMSVGSGGGTGGVQTSTLALGLARAAIGFLDEESRRRSELQSALSALREESDYLESALLGAVRGMPACSNEQLRQQANNLAIRSTQAALAAAKGAGFVAGHPAGRWCREALFFLVWSCPQPVLAAHLCELAGILE